MREFILKALCDMFKFLDVVLHVLEKVLLLLLLLLLVIDLLGLLHSHVLLELVEKSRELLFQVVVLLAEIAHFFIQELFLLVHCLAVNLH